MQTPEPQINPVEYYTETSEDVQIEVTPSYVAERSNPEHNQYFYSYKIKISNHSHRGVKIIHRHWKIKDGNGKSHDVQGSGVIGEQPMIAPNDSYEYTSFCPLPTPFGNMRGKYQMIDEFGNRFWVSVPLFFFRPPSSFIQ